MAEDTGTFEVPTPKTPFDLGSQRATLMDAGAPMQLTGPSGNLLYDEDNKPVTITLRARNSRAGLMADRAAGNRRLETARKQGKFETTVEGNEAEGTETLVGLTMGWTFKVLDGKPFPYTPENARAFWSDDRNVRWRRDALEFIASEANFMNA
jgi:hypothetical protein